ncbi:unnamed protein product [Rotaria magnacalcarata]|uniref:Integrase catalytic domain-containing protein n=1 Tax=Rotaria magnacalcarata TaxID=392030 RepID=A0A816ZGF2_9BILA|nr:unnamed protein product [Rotaria magnacalcarata]
MRKSQISDKCERWRLKLQSYDFTVKHIKGTSSTMPDSLSRSPVGYNEEDIDDVGTSISTTIATQTDTFDDDSLPVSPIVGMVTTRSRTRLLSLSNNQTNFSSNTDHSNLLRHTPTLPSSTIATNDSRIEYTGNVDHLKAVQEKDTDLLNTMKNLSDDNYINSYILKDGLLMHQELNQNNHIKSCIRCNQNNPIRRKPDGHLEPIKPSKGVWQLLSTDFHGPIAPTSRRGNKYIISINNVLSKCVIVKATRDCTASTAAQFLQEVICKYGTPKCILTDNGTHFTSAMINQLFQCLGITHLNSTPYHPQTNGRIERFNGTMDAKIAASSNQHRSDWDEQIPFAIFNYNTTSHSTTKIIPFELMLGR